MINITIALPNDVAQEYFNASEKLAEHFGDPAPNAQTLMRFVLAAFTAEEVVHHFDRTLRHMTGAPVSEPDILDPDFGQPSETQT